MGDEEQRTLGKEQRHETGNIGPEKGDSEIGNSGRNMVQYE
jgi:hypothetical protein